MTIKEKAINSLVKGKVYTINASWFEASFRIKKIKEHGMEYGGHDVKFGKKKLSLSIELVGFKRSTRSRDPLVDTIPTLSDMIYVNRRIRHWGWEIHEIKSLFLLFNYSTYTCYIGPITKSKNLIRKNVS
jgi:hypothetical protein